MKFRSYWQDRVVAGEVEIGTANKSIGHIAAMFRAINESKQLNLPPIFDRIRISGGKDGQRLAFAPAFVQNRIMAQGALDGLNPEARRVIYLIVETGVRLSEASNLSRETIRLDAAVPHICVAPNGSHIETDQSERKIPLVRRRVDGHARAAGRLSEIPRQG